MTASILGPRTGTFIALNASSGAEIWNYTTQDWVDSFPAVANGYVYVGSWEADKNIYCLDALTGAKIWNFTTHDGVTSSPAVVGDYVYVGGWDGNIYCLNALTGANVWTYPTHGHLSSSPAVSSGIVYVGSRDHTVYALGTLQTTPSPSASLNLSSSILREILYTTAVIISVAAIVIIATILDAENTNVLHSGKVKPKK